MASPKPFQALIIDTGPLIKNTVAISTLLQQAEELYTTSAIISEIRDPATRSRIETTLLPFLKVRNPNPASYEVVTQFSRRTGDFPVLSRQDLGILALAYEVECEKTGGTGVRTTPAQKETHPSGSPKENGQSKGKSRRGRKHGTDKVQEPNDAATEGVKPAVQKKKAVAQKQENVKPAAPTPVAPWAKKSPAPTQVKPQVASPSPAEDPDLATNEPETTTAEEKVKSPAPPTTQTTEPAKVSEPPDSGEKPLSDLQITSTDASEDASPPNPTVTVAKPAEAEVLPPLAPKEETHDNLFTDHENFPKAQDPSSSEDEAPEFSDDSDGDWITPTNITQHIAKDTGIFDPDRKPSSNPKSSSKSTTPSTFTPLPSKHTQIAVATITTDFAMQNVLLQMNLHLLSSSLSRIHTLRTHILRCHACFFTTKLMDKQFCPRCGQPTLQRIGCSTLASGEFKLHLSSKFTWNTRGNRYSIPKPVAGSANGRVVGGGKGNWGNELILAEDQKEYVRGLEEGKRVKARDLMDEDYLPGILTGDRGREGGRMKVGAGRNVNSKKRF